MSSTDDSGLDDALFPACDAAHAGTRHTDEYGVTYICDLIEDADEGPTWAWVLLDRPQDHQPGR